MVDGSPYDGALQHQIGGSEVGRSGHECQHGGGERVRRIGHYSKRPSWSDEVLEIALDHGGVAVMHLLPKPVGPPGVQFNCDDPSASFEERHSKGANAGT